MWVLVEFGLKVFWNFVKAPTNFLVAGLLVFGAYQTGHWKGDSYRNQVWLAQVKAEKAAQDSIILKTTNQAIAKVIELSIAKEKQDDLIATLRAEAAVEPTAAAPSLPINSVRRLNRIGPSKPVR